MALFLRKLLENYVIEKEFGKTIKENNVLLFEICSY